MTGEIRIPFGLCEITYDSVRLPSMADEGIFSATPSYIKMFGGALNSTQGYILENYEVKFTVPICAENYDYLKLHMPTLQNHEHGLFDNPSKLNIEGKKLIIHPMGVDNKEYDICIWNAYISPETAFNRIFKKEVDEFEVTFIGKPIGGNFDSKLKNSYFFIGDWEKAGGSHA